MILAPRLRFAAATVLVLCSSGCVEQTLPVEPLVLSNAAPKPIADQPAAAPRSAAPGRQAVEVIGTGTFVGAGPAGLAAPVPDAGGMMTLNFVEADIKEVVKSVLGNTFHMPYVLDPRVTGTVTLQTGRPVSRADAMELLQTALRADGATIIEQNGAAAVVPLSGAATAAPLSAGAAGGAAAGYSVRTFQLQNISPAEMAKIIQPFLPADRQVRAESTRPVLTVSGTAQELAMVNQLISMFDVDWMRGISVGVFPLETAKASDVVKELEVIAGGGGSQASSGAGAGNASGSGERETAGGQQLGLLRFLPIERLNSVLVVSPRPQHLATVRRWIAVLDRNKPGDTPRLFVYYPQNSRAEFLAGSLSEIFSGGRGRSGPDFNLAPGQGGADLSTGGFGGGYGGSGSGGFGGYGGSYGGGGYGGGGYGGYGGGLGGGVGGGFGTGGFGRGISSERPVRRDLLRSAVDTVPAPAPGPSAPRSANPLLGGMDPGSPTDIPTASDVRVIANREKNAVIILARPDEYRMIEQAIQRLDTAPLQVMIEATVAEVTLTDQLRYGLEWFFKGGSSAVTLSDAATGAVAPLAGFSYFLNSSKAQIVLNALAQLTTVNVVASPELLVLDNGTARLQVGDEVPIATASAVQTITNSSPVVNSIGYRDTGVILEVRPRVNNGGTVFLDVSQEVSQVANTSSSTIDSPTIQQRRLRSTIAVTDGQTVALGGLIRDNRTRGRSGIPILSQLPVVGLLFGTRTVNVDRTELLVLLTPHVIRRTEDSQAALAELQTRFRALFPASVPARR